MYYRRYAGVLWVLVLLAVIDRSYSWSVIGAGLNHVMYLSFSNDGQIVDFETHDMPDGAGASTVDWFTPDDVMLVGDNLVANGSENIYIYDRDLNLPDVLKHQVRTNSLAYDWINANLYYINSEDKTLNVMSLKTGYTEKIADSPDEVRNREDGRPTEVRVDPRQDQRYLYWTFTNEGANHGVVIQKCYLTGSHCETFVDMSTGDAAYINGLDIDYANNKLYWADAFHNTVNVIDLDGSNSTQLYDAATVTGFPTALAVRSETEFLLAKGNQIDPETYVVEHYRCDEGSCNVTELVSGGYYVDLRDEDDSRRPGGSSSCAAAGDCAACVPYPLHHADEPYLCLGDNRFTVTGVSPSTGPKAGGGKVTITGTGLAPGAGLRVRYGDETSVLGALCGDMDSSSTDTSAICTVQNVDDAMTSHLWFSWTDRPIPQAAEATYTFTDNPTITSISPKYTVLSGGVDLTVVGEHFFESMSIDFKIQVIVHNKNIDIQIPSNCSVVDTTQLLCVTPRIDVDIEDVRLPDPTGGSIVDTVSDMNVYVSFILASYTYYQNMRAALPAHSELHPYRDPLITTTGINKRLKTWPPNKVEDITLEGEYLYAGDLNYLLKIKVGSGDCEIKKHENTKVVCTPPKKEPERMNGDERHYIQVQFGHNLLYGGAHEIGYVEYETGFFQCMMCWIGLAAGVVVLVIIVAIVVVCCVLKHRRNNNNGTAAPQQPPTCRKASKEPAPLPEVPNHHTNPDLLDNVPPTGVNSLPRHPQPPPAANTRPLHTTAAPAPLARGYEIEGSASGSYPLPTVASPGHTLFPQTSNQSNRDVRRDQPPRLPSRGPPQDYTGDYLEETQINHPHHLRDSAPSSGYQTDSAHDSYQMSTLQSNISGGYLRQHSGGYAGDMSARGPNAPGSYLQIQDDGDDHGHYYGNVPRNQGQTNEGSDTQHDYLPMGGNYNKNYSNFR